MNISLFAIDKLSKLVVGDRKGREIIDLFNKYGSRDVYDEFGMPDIGKRNQQRPSKTEYVKKRLSEFSGKDQLRELLAEVLNANSSLEGEFNSILNPEGYGVDSNNGTLLIQGGVVDRTPAVKNEAHFQDIQSRILQALDEAKVSITVVMAWFTNDSLFQKLAEKHKSGIDVKLAIYDDGVNRKHGVDIKQLPHTLLKKGVRGGLMHNKFCVIDNQIVITGSYNWSDNAEFRNDENITIERDPRQATEYTLEFRRLTS